MNQRRERFNLTETEIKRLKYTILSIISNYKYPRYWIITETCILIVSKHLSGE